MDKKKKIRYLSIKQDKLEKKLIAEIERYAPNRPKVPRETQNPYQYLSTFNNLIGYFREKPRPYGPLFTWAQSHKGFTKIGIPYEFEKEYTEGAKKVSTKEKQRKLEEERMSKNYNTDFFEDIDFTSVNNVFDLLNNQHLITKLTKTEEGFYPTHEDRFKLKYSESHKLSGDTQNSQIFSKSRKTDKKQAKTMMRVSTEPQNTPTTHKTLSSAMFKKKNRGKQMTLPNFPQNSVSPTGKTQEDIPYLGEKVNKRVNTDEVLNSIMISGDNQNSFQQKKVMKTNSDEQQQNLNTTTLNLKKDEEENNLNKYQGIISHYGKQLLSSENYIKHRKLFNISKIQDQTLHNSNTNQENNVNEHAKKNKKLRIQTENDINDFYLNPFDLKNYSVNKILSNINEKSHDRFQGQINKMRENLKTHSGFLLKTRPRDYSFKIADSNKREKTTPANLTISSFSHQKGFPSATKDKTKKMTLKEINNFDMSESQYGNKTVSSPKKKNKNRGLKSLNTAGKSNYDHKESDQELESDLYEFKKEFADKLERALETKFNIKNSGDFQQANKYLSSLTDDNIFNYNVYFKKLYYNKGMRLDLSEKTKKMITDFEKKIDDAIKRLGTPV